MDCIDKTSGEYCTDCRGCANLKCENCLFYDEYYGCDTYKETGKCLFKYKI